MQQFKQYVSLEDIKMHLNIDLQFKDDDYYLLSCIEVAQDALRNHLNVDNLSEVEVEDEYNHGTHLPVSLIHAIKLMVGNLYNNRESVAPIQMYELPKSYDYLLTPYKKYSIV